jgi:DNA polymerase-4
MAQARRACPDAVVVPTRGARYRAVSASLFQILRESAPLVEPLSVDEAFLDVTGLPKGPAAVAEDIAQRVRAELGLTASVGGAPNKLVAKLASDARKPDGRLVLPPSEVQGFLDPLPATRLPGVGPVTGRALQRQGIRTVRDLRDADPRALRARLGTQGPHLHGLAHGRDERAVVPDEAAQQIGQERTFGVDLTSRDAVCDVLQDQAEQVAYRLRRHGFLARAVTIKLRDGAFRTETRQARLSEATDRTWTLAKTARELFEQWADAGFRPLRLAGVSAGGLARDGRQLPLFDTAADQREARLDAALDAIRGRHGPRAIRRGPRAGPADAADGMG